jgi:hypothetical protein
VTDGLEPGERVITSGYEAFKDNERKRDVFLTAGLTILSGCLPNVTYKYLNGNPYSNFKP